MFFFFPSSVAQYNKEQLIPVKVQDSDVPSLVTDFNDIGGGRFYDPRSKQTFKFDHLRKEASDFQVSFFFRNDQGQASNKLMNVYCLILCLGCLAGLDTGCQGRELALCARRRGDELRFGPLPRGL